MEIKDMIERIVNANSNIITTEKEKLETEEHRKAEERESSQKS